MISLTSETSDVLRNFHIANYRDRATDLAVAEKQTETRMRAKAKAEGDQIDYFVLPSSSAVSETVLWYKNRIKHTFVDMLPLALLVTGGVFAIKFGGHDELSAVNLFGGLCFVAGVYCLFRACQGIDITGRGKCETFANCLREVGTTVLGVGSKALYTVSEEDNEIRVIHFDAIGAISECDGDIVFRARFGDKTFVQRHPCAGELLSTSQIVTDLEGRMNARN